MGNPYDAVARQRKQGQLVILELPMPPSTNELWMKGMRLTSKYRAWRTEAGWELERQKPPHIPGHYTLRLIVNRNGTRMDLGNAGEKAISDLLQAHGVIDNDRLCEAIRITWGGDEIKGVRAIVVATTRQDEAVA